MLPEAIEHFTIGEVRSKSQAAIGEYDEPLTLVKKRKKEKDADRRRNGKTISKSGQEWTLLAQVWQLKTGQNE